MVPMAMETADQYSNKKKPNLYLIIFHGQSWA